MYLQISCDAGERIDERGVMLQDLEFLYRYHEVSFVPLTMQSSHVRLFRLCDYRCRYRYDCRYRCGENGGNWDLPDHPDEETRKVIEDHNQLDIMVYEAALQHFQLQKLAVVFSSDEDIE